MAQNTANDSERIPHACLISAPSAEAALEKARELASRAVCSGDGLIETLRGVPGLPEGRGGDTPGRDHAHPRGRRQGKAEAEHHRRPDPRPLGGRHRPAERGKAQGLHHRRGRDHEPRRPERRPQASGGAARRGGVPAVHGAAHAAAGDGALPLRAGKAPGRGGPRRARTRRHRSSRRAISRRSTPGTTRRSSAGACRTRTSTPRPWRPFWRRCACGCRTCCACALKAGGFPARSFWPCTGSVSGVPNI